jgi:hypothetical protein
MMPDEAIPTPLQNKPGHVYLVDFHAFHGNGDFPIFVNTGVFGETLIGGASYSLLASLAGITRRAKVTSASPLRGS